MRITPALAVLLLLGLGSPGCKRSKAPIVEEVWDDAPAVEQTKALANLAPPWPTPTRAQLDNGLLTFWLPEARTPVSHVRLMLPTGSSPKLQSAATLAVLQAYVVRTLGSRGRGLGLVAEAALAPDRVELVVHAPTEQLDRSLDLLAGVLSARTLPAASLEAARQDVLRELQGPITPDEQASAALVQALLGRPAGSQRAQRAAIESASRDDLLEAWTAWSDPRRAVLVVHAGDDASDHRDALVRLARRWEGSGRAPTPSGALARLRPDAPAPAATGRLLVEPPTPLTVVAGPEGKPVLMLGRVVPTATSADRSMARLAQRLLQEELDARLVVRGDISLFVLRVPLSSREPDRSVTEAVDALCAFVSVRLPTQRLFQAAQLWLGGRVVQASLRGEDWTALWSEAIDLATRNEDITAALARDAATMLATEPEALQRWMGRWLDPRAGEPGWRWVVAGASAAEQRRLGRIAPLR